MAQLTGSAEVAGFRQVRGRDTPRNRKFIFKLSAGFGPGVYSMTERKGSCKGEESRKHLWQEKIGEVSGEWRAFL